MANEVKLKLAIEGGQVVNTTLTGVTAQLNLIGETASVAAGKAAAGFGKMQDSISSAKKAAADAENATVAFISALERQTALHGKAASAALKYDAALLGATKSQREHIDGLIKTAEEQEKVGAGFSKMGVGAALLSAAVSAFSAIKMADAVTTLNTQLNLSTASAQKSAQAYESLFQIAQKSRVSFTELGTTYAAIARAGNEMGVSQGRLLAVTESISQAMTIGGGSAQSMQAALVQLGQGLSSGTLRGEELNSIMEQTPRLAKAIADGLGVPIGELRKLGETGQLTAQQVITALEKAGPQLAKEMASATLTVGQAMTLLGNSATKMVGEMDAASGASASLAGAIKSLSGAMDSVGETINKHQTAFAVITAGLAGAATVAGIYALGYAFVAATPAVVAFAAAFMATPLGPIALALAAVTAGVMGLKAAADSAAKSETGLGYALANLDERIAKLDASQESTWASGKKRLLEMRAERARLSAELALLSNKGLDTRAEDARLGATTGPFKEKEAAVKAYQSLKQELSGVNKDFQTHLNQLQAMRDAGLISEKQYVADVIELINKEGGARKAAAKTDHKTDTFQADVARAYTRAMEDLNKEELKATAIAEGYTKTQEILRGVMASPEFAAMSFRKKEEIILAASQAEAESDHATAITKVKKAYDDYVASAKSSADGVDRNLKVLQDETNAYAVAAEKNISLAEAIDVVAMARLGDEVIKAKIANNYDAVTQLEREIELRKQLAPLISKRDAHKAEIEANKKVNAEWKKGWEETDRLAREAFTGWAENGTSAAEAIGKSLKKALLSAIYEATIRPLAFQMYTSVAGGAASSMGGSALGSAAGGAASAAFMGGAVGTGFSAGAAATMNNMFLSGGTAANMGNIAALAEGGSISGAIGAAAPYLLAAYAIATMLKGGEYVKSLGASEQTFGANGSVSTASQGYEHPYGGGLNESGNGQDAAQKVTAGMYGTYKALAASLGAQSDAVRFAYGSNNSDGGRTSIGGGAYNSGEFKTSEAAISLEASRAVFAALQASSMPEYLASVFDKITVGTATQAQINDTLAYAQSLKTVRQAMLETRTPTQILQDTVAQGFTDLSTSAATFKTDFVAAIDAGLTPENFNAWGSLKAAMDSLDESMKSTADSVKYATDSIYAEIKRIKGITSGSATTYAGAQSAFAIATGQARAGDQTAIKDLPGLSKTMLDMARGNVSTLADLRIIEGQTAASLQVTGDMLTALNATALSPARAAAIADTTVMRVPTAGADTSVLAAKEAAIIAARDQKIVTSINTDGFWGGGLASGTDFVPRDMVTKIHRGERITPAAFNPTRHERGDGSDPRLLALVESLTTEVTMLRAEVRAVVKNTGKTTSLLDRAMPDGDAISTRVAA
jgi:tape measure domain-containing protein